MDTEALLVNRINRVYGHVVTMLAAIAMTAVAFMSISISADVLKRWGTGWPIGGVMQMSECLMVVLVFLAIPYAQRHRRHIRIAFVISRMRPKTIVAFDLIACIFAVLCLAFMGWKTAEEAIYSISILEYRTGDIRLPIYWARALIPVGIFVMTGQLIIGIWINITRLKGKMPCIIRDIRSMDAGETFQG